MKNKIRNQVISLMLAILIISSIMPSSAFADLTNGIYGSITTSLQLDTNMAQVQANAQPEESTPAEKIPELEKSETTTERSASFKKIN